MKAPLLNVTFLQKAAWERGWGGEQVSFQNERQELGKCPYILSPQARPGPAVVGELRVGAERKLRFELVENNWVWGRAGCEDQSVLLQVILNVNEREGEVLSAAGN